jgi:tetratricopeptide (TPR) repeat protein
VNTYTPFIDSIKLGGFGSAGTPSGIPAAELGRECVVAVVNPNQTLRTHLIKVLRDAGYNNTQSFADLKTAKEYLEVDVISWLWTPLCLGAQVNAFQFLEMTCASAELSGVRTSILFNESEYAYIPLAFELGMMSWHNSPETPAAFQTEVRNALALLSKHRFITPLVACDQLETLIRERPLLSKDDQRVRQSLFKTMATLFPTSPYAVLSHATCEFEAGHKGAGYRAIKLAQAQNLAGWDQAAQRHLGTDFDPKSSRLFDIDSYLIVEPDETVHNHIEALMRPFGVKRVHRFTDGERALQWLEKSNRTDLIIQEWKLPSVAGSSFLQRARHIGAKETPVLVVSSLIKKTDESLLREMGVARTVQKPLIDHEFVSSLTQTLSEFTDPSSERYIERRIQVMLETGRIAEAKAEAQKLLRGQGNQPGSERLKDPLSECSRSFIAGLMSYHSHDYAAAKESFLKALNDGGDSLQILNALARTLIHMRDFKAAARCYEKAQEISPKNVYRLLEMAETYSEIGQTHAVTGSLRKAESIDPTNPELATMQARIALKQGNIPQASKIFSGLSDKKTLIADLNNSGVVYIKTGQIDKGIDVYDKALKLIGNATPLLWARVTYNLALAQAKAGRVGEARRSVERIIATMRSDEALANSAEFAQTSKKVASLHDKLCRHIADSAPLQFLSTESTNAAINESFWNRMEGAGGNNTKPGQQLALRTHPSAQPGERCLHLIYRSKVESLPKGSLKTLLGNRITHQPRQTIAKEISSLMLEFSDFDEAPENSASAANKDRSTRAN